MAKRKPEISRQTIESAQAKAEKANGWLALESKAGRLFLISSNTVRCRPTVVEFVDADDWHIKLAYDQIADVKIKDRFINPPKSLHRRLCHR